MTKPFTYLSVCSGIEAASVAWESLGWRPAAFAEIDPFACHVLAHQQRATRPMFMPAPDTAPGFVERRKRMTAIKAVAVLPDPGTPHLTPNFGDLEAWRNWPDAAFDLLVGGTPCQSFKDYGADAGDTAPTLRAMNNAASQANGGGQIAIAIQERAVSENPAVGPDGAGFRQDGAAYALEARTVPQAVAFDLRGREGGAMPEGPHETASMRAASGGSSRSYVAQEADPLIWAVRRLTPRECERLQGFPDAYTDVPWRRRNWAPDGPRYKALGNSMAVNVMGWLGERIVAVEAVREFDREILTSK